MQITAPQLFRQATTLYYSFSAICLEAIGAAAYDVSLLLQCMWAKAGTCCVAKCTIFTIKIASSIAFTSVDSPKRLPIAYALCRWMNSKRGNYTDEKWCAETRYNILCSCCTEIVLSIIPFRLFSFILSKNLCFFFFAFSLRLIFWAQFSSPERISIYMIGKWWAKRYFQFGFNCLIFHRFVAFRNRFNTPDK